MMPSISSNERERLQKEIARTGDEIDKVLKKLNSPEFVSRAPEEIVAEIRTRHDELCEKLRKLESNLNHLPVELHVYSDASGGPD